MKTSFAIHFPAARTGVTPARAAAWTPEQGMGSRRIDAARALTTSSANADSGETHALDARSLR
jgi:hypothetical protein